MIRAFFAGNPVVKKSAALVWCALLVLPLGCITERVRPVKEYPFVPKQTTFLVNKIEYDTHGRPLFSHVLSGRPGRSGDRFAIVHAVNDRPVRSYDIAIVDQQKADLTKPFAVIYEWTGRGFEGGLDISGRMFPQGVQINSRDEALAYLAIMTAPIVIGTVTGFVVGIVSSIPVTATELQHVVVNSRETVIGYTVYEYDAQGRIRFMRTYPPAEHAEALVKTEYFYSGDGRDPFKTEVTSVAENKKRIIQ
jgi:hypothetical protein